MIALLLCLCMTHCAVDAAPQDNEPMSRIHTQIRTLLQDNKEKGGELKLAFVDILSKPETMHTQRRAGTTTGSNTTTISGKGVALLMFEADADILRNMVALLTVVATGAWDASAESGTP